MSTSSTLVLLRHGQSIWNKEHRLTGWSDVGLTDAGRRQAAAAGKALAAAGFRFDAAYTSQLCRATESLDLVLAAMGQDGIDVSRWWQLNERHYGALEGMGPLSAALKFGLHPFVACQRRFYVSPPLLDPGDPRFPGNQDRYAEIPPSLLPRAETMAQAMERMLPVWDSHIAPALRAGQCLLIVAHKNTLRGMVKHITGCSAREAERLSIRTGRPWVFEFGSDLKPIRDRLVAV